MGLLAKQLVPEWALHPFLGDHGLRRRGANFHTSHALSYTLFRCKMFFSKKESFAKLININ